MRRISKIAIALETQAPAPVAEVSVVEAPVSNLASTADVEEVIGTASDMQAFEAQIDETIDIQAALESFRETLQGAVGDAGLSPTSTAIFKCSSNYFDNRLGVSKRTTVSLESYHGNQPTDRATAALEGIKETATKIWNAIIAAVQKLVQWMKDLLNKIFDLNNKTKKEAEELSKNMKKWAEERAARRKAEEAAKSAPKAAVPKSFNDPELQRHLVIDSKFPANIVGAAKDFNAFGKNVLTYDVNFPIDEVLNLLSKIEKREKWDADQFKVSLNDCPGMHTTSGNAFWNSRPHTSAPSDMHFTKGPQTFGNMTLYMCTPKNGLSGLKAIDAVAESMILITGGMLADYKAPPIPVLSIEDCQALVEHVQEMSEMIEKYENERRTLDYGRFRDKVIISVGKIRTLCETTPYNDLAKDLGYPSGVNHITSLLHSVARYADGPASLFARHAAEKNQKLLQYANKCFHLHAGRQGGYQDQEYKADPGAV